MYFRVLILSGCVALAGCQSSQVIEQATAARFQEVNSISALATMKMKLPSSATVDITSETQVLNFGEINSPVAVFELPANRGGLEITITSNVSDSVFYPSAIIVDKNSKILESYQGEDFEYKKPRLHLGNRIQTEKDFFPPYGEESIYLIVYTTEKDLAGVTNIIHPARLDAEARGNYLPEVKDIPKPHYKTGRIEVSIEGAGFMVIGSVQEQLSTAAPAEAKKASIIAAQPETQSYYHNAIKKAVKANNIPKALDLLDESKALNIEGAQEVFVRAVNSD